MSGMRPRVVVAMVGTGTEVGKTWVAASALAELRDRGATVAARKPAQSAEPDDPAPSDAAVLAAATGEDEFTVCPAHRRYAVAMAPPMAADVLGLERFTVADLAAETAWPRLTAGVARTHPADGSVVDVGLVETAGGLLSPAAADGTSLDLALAVDPDVVVLVADAGLGTINGVRLCLSALAPRWSGPVVVVLNRYDDTLPLHRANRDLLAAEAPAGGPVTVLAAGTDASSLADHVGTTLDHRSGGRGSPNGHPQDTP